MQSYEFKFDADKTCKINWGFDLIGERGAEVIHHVRVTPAGKPDGKEMGCKGHPKTIAALLRGRTLASVDVDALIDTACGRPCSCGQSLAECIAKLREAVGAK